MFNSGSFRFWRNAIYGMLGICVALSELNENCGTIRRDEQCKKLRIGAIIFDIFLFSAAVFLLRPFQREMAIPNILSGNYKEIEGTVYDYEKDNRNSVILGGSMDVKENKTRKVYKFREIHVPSDLRRRDSVKMLYIRYYRSGACVEVNGREVEYWMDNNVPMGIVLVILLLLSIPFYYFQVYKVKPLFEYDVTCAVYVYHDKYIKTMKIVYFFMVLSAIVLIIALKGEYRSIFDIFWGLILIADYAGVFYLSFLHQKKFIIMKDKFYYCSYKKRLEGGLSEIEGAEKTDSGVVIRTKDAEMEVFCTSERYREALINKLA